MVDIETTGLSKRDNHITEIAALRMRNREVVDSFQSLVNPQVRIPIFITKLTGINNTMVKNAPTIKEVLPSFTKFLGDDVFVAHNATFDHSFVEYNLGRSLANPKLCTRKLAIRLFPNLARKRLVDLCNHMNVKNIQAHRAMGDAQAAAAVFSTMLNILHSKGITKVPDVLKFERGKIGRCLRR